MKTKRVICKLWGHRLHGGYVFRRDELTDALRKGDAFDFKGIQVGSRQLKELIHLLPQDFCLLRANGGMEVETVDERWRKDGDSRKCHFVKPSHDYAMFKVFKGAWMPKSPKTPVVTVVLQAQKY